MNKLRLAVVGLVAVLVTLLSPGAAQAYPDCGIPLKLTLSDSNLSSGKSFTFTAEAGQVDGADVPGTWTVKYDGEAKSGDGPKFTGSFDTDDTDDTRTARVTAVYTFEVDAMGLADSSAAVTQALYTSGPSTALKSATFNCPVSASFTLLGEGDDGDDDSNGSDSNGALPNTGGSSLWIILLGAGLVMVGGGLTYATRRRHTTR